MNFKLISFACVISFVLSFFVALISGAGFGISVLRALIIAVCFGVLFFGINFLYEKFLKDESNDGQNADNSAEENLSPIGNKVDITIDGEDLPDEDDSPHFTLTGQNQMLNKNDFESVSRSDERSSNENNSTLSSSNQNVNNGKNEKPTVESNNANLEKNQSNAQNNSTQNSDSFKPITLGSVQSAKNDSSEPSEFPDIESSLGENSILAKPKSADSDEVDSFPEMEVASVRDQTVTDSEFAEAGKPSSRLSDAYFSDGEAVGSKDSNLMAEAIRTILKKEE